MRNPPSLAFSLAVVGLLCTIGLTLGVDGTCSTQAGPISCQACRSGKKLADVGQVYVGRPVFRLEFQEILCLNAATLQELSVRVDFYVAVHGRLPTRGPPV